jgi:hypothetical protein
MHSLGRRNVSQLTRPFRHTSTGSSTLEKKKLGGKAMTTADVHALARGTAG